jgi:hypothetical protein
MKCEACQSVLEEYFDGELSAKAATEVRAHLASCPACAAELTALRQSHELYTRYERDVEVTPALWAGIEARIKAERVALADREASSGWRDWFKGLFALPHISPAWAAALVVLAIGLTVVVMTYLNSRSAVTNNPVAVINPQPPTNSNTNPTTTPAPTGDGTQPPLVAKKEPGSEENTNEPKDTVKKPEPAPSKRLVAGNKPQAPPDPMKLVREAEQKYLAAIAILSQDVTRHRSQIDPAVLARFDSALADIDRTIAETRQVVRRNPDDPVALQYLLSAYAKKVDTLRAMSLD